MVRCLIMCFGNVIHLLPTVRNILWFGSEPVPRVPDLSRSTCYAKCTALPPDPLELDTIYN
jgi:hypothetical protein